MSQTLDQLQLTAVRPATIESGLEDFNYKPIPPLAPVSALLGVCALSGLLSLLGLVFAVFGLVLGLIGRRQIQRAEGDLGGSKIAMAGVTISAVLLVCSTALHVYWYQTEVPAGFQRISFGADISKKGFVEEDGEGRAHPDIAALSGKPLFLKGFIYPEGRLDGISSFILCKDNGQCCFGGQPKLTDMIRVKMVDGQTARYSEHMVSVAGVFKLRDLRAAGNLNPHSNWKRHILARPKRRTEWNQIPEPDNDTRSPTVCDAVGIGFRPARRWLRSLRGQSLEFDGHAWRGW